MVSDARKRVAERWSKIDYRSGSIDENGYSNKRSKPDIIDLTLSDTEEIAETSEHRTQRPSSEVPEVPVGNCPFRIIKSDVFDSGGGKSQYFTDLNEIFNDPTLHKTFLFSFQYELDFLMGHFHHNVERIVLVAQEGTVLSPTTPQALSLVPKTLLIQFRMPPFTCHHSKLVINIYEDGACRIFMPSSNFTYAETNYPQQVCWRSPRLRAVTNPPTVAFQQDLIRYMDSYNSPDIQKYITPCLKNLNFEPLNDVQFIYSTPSKNYVSGLRLLAAKISSLKQDNNKNLTHHYLCQSSSVGNSLSKKTSVNLFTHLMIPVLDGMIPADSKNTPETSRLLQLYKSRSVVPYLLYPTVQEISSCPAGWLCSGWFNFNYNRDLNHFNMLRKQFKVLYKQDNAVTSKQRRATPAHSKFYLRSSTSAVNEAPFKKLDWCVYTSANLSYSAWGKTRAKPRNYEVGILLTSPNLYCQSFADLVYKGKSTSLPQGVTVAVPWTTSLEPYGDNDEAFCISKEYEMLDCNGRRLS
ncbi:TDP1 (YBR223C) [Zygosaccharomyces parabailii]|nr:TDP1 (YBR223C) [Zygosaccharomyces parabailii]CDH14566.1 related to Tyrosyl-DNA phosphodiesterase 1 [Zygosaccharomyces bailii ISA1307]